jgi:hypothetical protein
MPVLLDMDTTILQQRENLFVLAINATQLNPEQQST